MCYYTTPVLRVQEVVDEVKRIEHTEDYQCLEYSKELQERLEAVGVGSSVIIGQQPNVDYKHAIVGIWIEPQTGELVNVKDFEFEYIYNE